MSLVGQAQRHALEVKARLFSPKNAIVDIGIDLKRKVIPIKAAPIQYAGVENVAPEVILPVTTLDVFGPQIITSEDLAFGPVVRAPLVKTIWISEIQAAVCEKYRIPINEVMSHRRTAEVVRARHVAMYLARKLTTRSLPEIGRRFGGKDHTVIIHACRKIERLRNEDQTLDGEIVELIETITA